jgi:ketosteroid isomerase-like protein
MSAEENKAIFLKFIDELGRGNLSVIDEVCSPNFAFHSPNWPDWPRGLEGARALVTLARKLFADTQGSIEDIFAEGDKVVVRTASSGTYIGEAKPGSPNPGDRFSLGTMSMYRFVDGKIEDDWGVEVFGPVGKPWG